jgi:hypothetical protein
LLIYAIELDDVHVILAAEWKPVYSNFIVIQEA